MSTIKTGYFSNREMRYGRPGGETRLLERGEIFQLNGAPNDVVMIENNYIIDIKAREMTIDTHPCVRCSKEFADSAYMTGHNLGPHCRGDGQDEPVAITSGASSEKMPGEATTEV